MHCHSNAESRNSTATVMQRAGTALLLYCADAVMHCHRNAESRDSAAIIRTSECNVRCSTAATEDMCLLYRGPVHPAKQRPQPPSEYDMGCRHNCHRGHVFCAEGGLPTLQCSGNSSNSNSSSSSSTAPVN